MNFEIIEKACRALCIFDGIDPDAEVYLSEGVTVPIWTEKAYEAGTLAIMVMAHLRDNIEAAVSLEGETPMDDRLRFAKRFKAVMTGCIASCDPNVDPATYDPATSLTLKKPKAKKEARPKVKTH